MELLTSLMCTSRPSGGRQPPTPLPSNFHEMMRSMVDAGVRRALLQVLRGLDLNHPKVRIPPVSPSSQVQPLVGLCSHYFDVQMSPMAL